MANEDNPFESPRLLLGGARRHRDAFAAQIDALRATGWGEPVANPDGSVAMKTLASVPPEMKQIVFDFTGNLRSALDHAVYAAVVTLTGTEFENGTKFPIGDTPKDAVDDAKRKCRNVPKDFIGFLLAFEVHRQGNAIVWALNKLRNTKSHRVLVPFAAATTHAGAGEPSAGTAATYEWDQETGRLKNNLQLAPGATMGGIMHIFRLEVLIGTGMFRGEPALGIFDRMFGEVERIVSAIEAETARILRERGR